MTQFLQVRFIKDWGGSKSNHFKLARKSCFPWSAPFKIKRKGIQWVEMLVFASRKVFQSRVTHSFTSSKCVCASSPASRVADSQRSVPVPFSQGLIQRSIPAGGSFTPPFLLLERSVNPSFLESHAQRSCRSETLRGYKIQKLTRR